MFVEDGDSERDSAGVIVIVCLMQYVTVDVLCEGGSEVEFARLMGSWWFESKARVKTRLESTSWDQNITTRQHMGRDNKEQQFH